VQLENSFEVPASPAAAWALLNDVPRVVPCLPGAELTEELGDDAWRATLHVKLGPIALQFLADVTRQAADDEERRVELAVRAREARGRGGATATIRSSLAEIDEGGTRVSLVTDLSLQGPVAQYGRGVVGSVAAELTRQFADCLARRLHEEAPPTPVDVKPVGGISLALRGLWNALRRAFRR
jgi:carbon monoxide dehydrogenase subunit G